MGVGVQTRNFCCPIIIFESPKNSDYISAHFQLVTKDLIACVEWHEMTKWVSKIFLHYLHRCFTPFWHLINFNIVYPITVWLIDANIFFSFCSITRSCVRSTLCSQFLTGLTERLHQLLAMTVQLIQRLDAGHLVVWYWPGCPPQCQLSRRTKRILLIKRNESMMYSLNSAWDRAIFMEDHIPIRPDRSLLLGRLYGMWSSMKITLLSILTFLIKNIFLYLMFCGKW